LQQHRPAPQVTSTLAGPKEKDKMLQGDLFMPFSTELQSDRETCKARLDRFNGNVGIGADERRRLLRQVFEPQDQIIARHPGSIPPTPRVGRGVYVDAPFRCDYGYNITIGEDVSIEAGCFISDAREVYIGPNTMIGPGVKIMGKQYPQNPADRKGTLNGKARGFKIIIGEGVCIGAGCILSPSEESCKNGELHIGNGAYIPDGTVVTKVCLCALAPLEISANCDRMFPITLFSELSLMTMPVLLSHLLCTTTRKGKTHGEVAGTWVSIETTTLY
jgi:acetyltransferase-like isoleucine patch superfamily enzyme